MTIIINGKIYEQARVIMQPTYDMIIKEGDLVTSSPIIDGKLNLSIAKNVAHKSYYGYDSLHLYIVSDEKIEDNDWYLLNHLNEEPHQCKGTGLDAYWYATKCSKIIATTNKSLHKFTGQLVSNRYKVIKPLPNPTLEFIEKYITEYNNGNFINDVLVECAQNWVPEMFEAGDIPEVPQETFLKVDSNNTISIRVLKTIYTREEVIALVEKALYAKASWYQEEIDEWMLQNL